MKQIVTSKMVLGTEAILIDGYVHYTVDTSYGEDADGKRGVKRIFVEDVTHVQGYDKTLNTVGMTKEDIDMAGEILTREFLEG